MRLFMPWVGWNLVRFVVVWVVVAGAAATVIDFDVHDVVPRSPLKVLFVPFALLLILFVAVFSATVALALVSPAAAALLVVYLAVLWWLRGIVRGKALRLAAVVLALLPFPLLAQSDRQILAVAIVVAIVYGSVVRLPPDRLALRPTAHA